MVHTLDPAVHAPVFATIQHLFPERLSHPLGCHRRRVCVLRGDHDPIRAQFDWSYSNASLTCTNAASISGTNNSIPIKIEGASMNGFQ